MGSTDQALGLLIEELTARIQAGQLIDVEGGNGPAQGPGGPAEVAGPARKIRLECL
jgi:hypothetical protein